MILLDTHALLWWALDPGQLSPVAAKVVDEMEQQGGFASSISIWELGVKIMRGKQPYDAGNKVIAVPHLFGPGGYWQTYDWGSAIGNGMKLAGLPYSGQYGFVETDMYWKVNHMVVPKGQALKCNACHGKDGVLDWKALGYPGDPRAAKK